MYRDTLLARDAQNEALRVRLARVEADLEDSQRARERSENELARIKEGVAPDPELSGEVEYVWTRRGLVLLAGAAVVTACYLVDEVRQRWMPDLLLDARGLRNLGWSLMHGEGLRTFAAVAFVATLCLPWVLLPWLGLRGLDRQRRWGWTTAVVGLGLFVPTPLFPIAAFGLVVLLSPRVRRVFFADAR